MYVQIHVLYILNTISIYNTSSYLSFIMVTRYYTLLTKFIKRIEVLVHEIGVLLIWYIQYWGIFWYRRRIQRVLVQWFCFIFNILKNSLIQGSQIYDHIKMKFYINSKINENKWNLQPDWIQCFDISTSGGSNHSIYIA